MITDWETNFADLQADDLGKLGKNNSGNILVGNHAVIFTEINSPRFFSVGNVCVWTMALCLLSSFVFAWEFCIEKGGDFR